MRKASRKTSWRGWTERRLAGTAAGVIGAMFATLLFLVPQAAAVPPVASFVPPFAGPAVPHTGVSRTGSGCGAAITLFPPSFNMANGNALEAVRATSCAPFGTYTSIAVAGVDGLQFRCGGPCITGPNELWSNWTVPYSLTDTFNCPSGTTSGSATNAVSVDLRVIDVTAGGTTVASTANTVATNNEAPGVCGTRVITGPGAPPTSVALWAALTVGHVYDVETFVAVEAECETPSAGAATCTATGDLTFNGGPFLVRVDVS